MLRQSNRISGISRDRVNEEIPLIARFIPIAKTPRLPCRENDLITEEKMNQGISRRCFLRGGLAAGALVATGGLVGCDATKTSEQVEAENSDVSSSHSWEVTPDPIDDSLITETIEVDVVVVGGGTSGLYTAASCVQNGLSVAVIEKDDVFNANGGATFAINSDYQKEMGLEVDPTVVMNTFIETNNRKQDEKIVWTFADRSGEAMNWLCDLMSPYGLSPVMQGYVEGPISGAFPGTLIFQGGSQTPTTNADYDPYSGDLGLGFVPQLDVNTNLMDFCEKNGVSFHFDTSSERIVRDGDDGPVTGIIASDKEGVYKKFVGSKGVIIASGCYGADEEMMAYFCPEIARSEGVTIITSNTGDLHRQAMWIGASMQRWPDHAPSIFCGEAHGVWDVLVNVDGKRFTNEDAGTSNLSAAILRQKTGKCYGIWDEGYASELPAIPGFVGDSIQTPETILKNWDVWIEREAVFKCDTLEELADNLSLDSAVLKNTVEEYNKKCEAGYDEDFHKRSDLLFPLDPPYYGGQFGVAMLTVHGGLHVNERSQVLDSDDTPLDNLYAVGCAAGDFWANIYSTRFAGISHGHCLTFAYLVGRQLAGIE